MAQNGRQAAVALLLILAVAAAAAAPDAAAPAPAPGAPVAPVAPVAPAPAAPAPAPTPAQGKEVTHIWHVGYAIWSPDCVETMVLAVNGSHPGPTIEATVGDTVIVKVKNKLPTAGLVIHWHGMHQRGTPWADGAAYVSQCPILPEEEFTYNFTVDHSGTFFWHGHFGMQRQMGLYGWLIVHAAPDKPDPFKYDEELKIILNDWWHRSVFEHELRLLNNPFGWVGEPQSLLMGGQGQYNCTKIPLATLTASDVPKCDASNPQCSHYVLKVKPNKTYRLRIASVASLSSLNFILEDHPFKVVEADGNYIEPKDMTDIDVYSGETYSVLFTTKDSRGNYWAVSNVRGRHPLTPPGLAILNYEGNRATEPTTEVPVGPKWNNYDYSIEKAKTYVAREGSGVSFPKDRPKRILNLLSTQNLHHGVVKWAINNISFELQATPALHAVRFNLLDTPSVSPPDTYDNETYDISANHSNPNTTVGSGFYKFEVGEIVDIVLQNSNMLNFSHSDVHPWHVHGHDFWILGYGKGKFNFESDYDLLNEKNPPHRNTAPVFPFGWTYIRFKADNPGAWPFHRHLEAHVHMGMSVLFVVGEDKIRAMDIPVETLGCGRTKSRPSVIQM